MSCAEYRSILTELARRGMVSAAEAQSARGHGETCAACRVHERNQERVSTALAGWAAESVLPAPDLWARIDGASVASAPSPRWRRWAVAAGVAACLGLWGMYPRSHMEPAPARWKAPAAPVLISVQPTTPAPEVRRVRRRQSIRVAATQPAPVVHEVATEFLPVVPADSWASDSGQLVRVRMPRTALLAFGLPMNPNRADEPVRADVVVGADGAVRAIRFIE